MKIIITIKKQNKLKSRCVKVKQKLCTINKDNSNRTSQVKHMKTIEVIIMIIIITIVVVIINTRLQSHEVCWRSGMIYACLHYAKVS